MIDLTTVAIQPPGCTEIAAKAGIAQPGNQAERDLYFVRLS
jgi:hypothetical protein